MMRTPGIAFLLACAPGFAQTTAPSAAPPDPKLLSRITEVAVSAQSRLPDFISTQTTLRTEDPNADGHWKRRDTIETEFTYLNRKPTWKLTKVNGKATKTVEMRTGFRSDNILQFFSLPGSLFGAKAETSFEWLRWDTLEGRRVGVYSLSVEQYASQLAFSGRDDRVVVGYHGLMFADAESAQVMRLEIRADTPADLPVKDCTVDVDYHAVTLAGQVYFLPAKATVSARVGRSIARNETDVLRYQKYAADATLKFDDN